MRLMKWCDRHCRPGGWVDIAEYEMVCFSDDGSVQESMTLSKFYVLINQAVEKSGLASISKVCPAHMLTLT